jgi:zinc transporter ZupT
MSGFSQRIITKVTKVASIISIIIGALSPIPLFYIADIERQTNPLIRNLNPILFKFLEFIAGAILVILVTFFLLSIILGTRYFFRERS